MVLLEPPLIQAHTWRSLSLADLHGYRALALACAHADQTTPPSQADIDEKFKISAAQIASQTMALANDQGAVRACAWLTPDDSMNHEYRVFLDLLIAAELRSAHRNLAADLLAWAESRSRELFAQSADQRPCVLRLDFYHQDQDTIDQYGAAGFRFALAEDEMRRDLAQPIPAHPWRDGMSIAPWSEETASAFFAAYTAAFRDRPGFPGWNEETWRGNMTGHDEFRPEFSILVRTAAGAPAGFVICAVAAEQADCGHVIQMGVVPAYRHMGIANALLAETMRRFAAAGLHCATLEVNANNLQAARVYRFTGFEVTKRYSSYRKTL